MAFGTATDYASVLSDRTDVARKTWLRYWFQARMDQETVQAANRLQTRFVQGGQEGDFELKLLDELGRVGEVAAEGALERAVLGGECLVRLAHELDLALEVGEPCGGAEPLLLALPERGLELGLLLLEELLAQPRLLGLR